MNKLIVSISFLAVVFVFSTVKVFGCTCMHLERPIENEYERYPAIFSGKVIRSVKSGKWGRNLKVTVQVQNSWKGKLPKTVTISTADTSSMCGYGFVKGKSYLIYANGKRANDLGVTICSRTTLLSDASEDVEALNNLQKKAKSSLK